MQNSIWRDSSVVYPGRQIPGLEEERIVIMGPWKSYASLVHSAVLSINPLSNFAAGAGKSVLWCAVSPLSLIREFIF